ncbi:MAG: hypothetical protein WB562_04365 [Candidatus Sulfotelmatobacter sp.]
MHAFRFLNVAILSVLVATSAALYAQDEKQQEEKPARQEEPKPQPKHDEARPARQDEAKPAKTEKQEAKPGKMESRDQVKTEQRDHPEQARPAGKSARIPDDKFRAHFGHSHTFKARTVIVEGQPRFQYGGYSFTLVDAWPVGWAYTDDCYIDYVDGEYFLFDLLHPGVRVAVFVVM